jgi:uncharacterized membrane protein
MRGRRARQDGAVTVAGYQPIEAPSQHDGFVRGISEPIGGPLGRHATQPRDRFWVVVRLVVALTALTLMLHWSQKVDCADGNWVKLKEYRHACYTDVVALYNSENLVKGKVPYVDQPVEYPVLTGLFMAATGLPVHAATKGHPDDNPYTWFYNINAFALGLAAIGTVLALVMLRRRRPWDAAMFGASPALLLAATINWDLIAVLLAVCGVLAWARRHPALAGVLLSLGASAKLWPAVLFIPLFMLGWRARRVGEVVFSASVAVLVWVLVNLPFIIFYTDNWRAFYRFNYDRGIDWGTVWYIGANMPHLVASGAGVPGFGWLTGHVAALNIFSYGLFALSCVGLFALTAIAPRRPRLGQLAFLTVAAFLIFSKVWSPQYVLWLVPLAVLARPRWGAFLAWQLGEVCYYFALDGELMRGSGNPIFPEATFVIGALIRLVTLLVLCGFVVRDIMRPEGDVVRDTYDDDPDGGIFDGVDDRTEPMGALRLDRTATG